jgi:hypothetical protein
VADQPKHAGKKTKGEKGEGSAALSASAQPTHGGRPLLKVKNNIIRMFQEYIKHIYVNKLLIQLIT